MSLQLRKFRSAPAVNDLEDLKKIIQSLEYFPIPYSYLDTANLKKLIESDKLNRKIYNDIENWKRSNDIKLGSGYLSEIINLLRVLEVIKNKKPTKDDLENYLEPNGPLIQDIITDKNNVQELTKIGYELCDIIKLNNSKLYETYLFWLFLKNDKLIPIWQYLLQQKEVYSVLDLRKAIKNIENDSFTISAFVNWSRYFNLCKFTTESDITILDRKKIAMKFLYAIILELNHSYVNNDGVIIEILVKKLTGTFHVEMNRLNFYNILEAILVIDDKNSVEGSYTGRGEKTLPSFPKINKLKIRKKIEIFPKFNKIPEKYLLSFMDLWG